MRLHGTPALVGIFANQRHFRNDHIVLYRLLPNDWASCQATSRGEISEIIWTDPLNPHVDATDATTRRLDEVYRGIELDPLW